MKGDSSDCDGEESNRVIDSEREKNVLVVRKFRETRVRASSNLEELSADESDLFFECEQLNQYHGQYLTSGQHAQPPSSLPRVQLLIHSTDKISSFFSD